MSEIYVACRPFTKNKDFKNQDIQDILVKTNYIMPAFNMTLLMEILKIYIEEQLVMKCNPIKHLILVEIQKYD